MAQGHRDEYLLRAGEKDTMDPGTAILEAEKLQNEWGYWAGPAVSPAPHLPEGLVKETQGPWGLVVQASQSQAVAEGSGTCQLATVVQKAVPPSAPHHGRTVDGSLQEKCSICPPLH